MKECFPLRFNLDECCSPLPHDQARAVAALFALDEEEVRRCAEDFSEHVKDCAASLDASLRAQVQECFAGRRVAFFGDSITSDKLGYAHIAAAVLPQADNYAVSGTTSAQLLRALEQNLAGGLPYASVVFIGTNDACECSGRTVTTAAEYERNLRDILSRLRGCAKKIVFLLPGGVQYGEQTHKTFNEAILRAAAEHGFETLDTAFVSAMEQGYEPDGVHLSIAAQRRAAMLVLKKLCGRPAAEGRRV